MGLAFSGGTTNVPLGDAAFVVAGLDEVLVDVRFEAPGTDGVAGAGVEVTTGVGVASTCSVLLTVAEGTGEGVGVAFMSEVILTEFV
jgi:hypothetical protein